jgi:energy-coupling factor transporter ATP-binding protein EcfA2
MNNYQQVRQNNRLTWLLLGKKRTKIVDFIEKMNHPVTAKEIQGALGISLQQFAYIKKQLLEKKLIKCINPDDHHGKRFKITRAGKNSIEFIRSMDNDTIVKEITNKIEEMPGCNISAPFGSGKTQLAKHIYGLLNNKIEKNEEQIRRQIDPDYNYYDRKNDQIINIEFKKSELNDTIQQLKYYMQEADKIRDILPIISFIDIKKIKQHFTESPFFQPNNAKKEDFLFKEDTFTIHHINSVKIVIFHFMIFDTEYRFVGIINKKLNKNDLTEIIKHKDLELSKEISELIANIILEKTHTC